MSKQLKSLILSAVLSFLLLYIYSYFLSEIKMNGSAMMIDILFGVAISLLLMPILRAGYIASAISAIIPVSVISVFDKFSLMFNKSLSAFDLRIDAIKDSLYFLEIGDIILIALPIALPTYSINWHLKTLKKSIIYLAVILSVGYAGVVYSASSENHDFRRVGDFGKDSSEIGRIPYFLKTLTERVAQSEMLDGYTSDGWDSRYKDARLALMGSEKQKKPNVYIAVLESFYDFENSNFEKETLPWNETYKKTIQPHVNRINASISGGGSVNTEFEILCGVPSLQKAEKMDFYLIKKIHKPKCMLGLAEGLGYTSRVLHAGIPWHFGSDVVYQGLGFDEIEYLDKRDHMDYDTSDVVSDEELLRVAVDRATSSEKPSINYLLGVYGHRPFINNPEKYPVIVDHSDLSEYQARAISQEYYRQQFIVDFIDDIKLRDPDAVVIILGDHTPPIAKYKGKAPFKDAYSTPLIVYAGREFKSFEGLEVFEVYQLAFDLISGGEFCKSAECYDDIERVSQKASELYFSFASSAL